ncbi:hypothetical protein [Streptomyces sp.]
MNAPTEPVPEVPLLAEPRQNDWDETPAEAAEFDRRYWNED